MRLFIDVKENFAAVVDYRMIREAYWTRGHSARKAVWLNGARASVPKEREDKEDG